MMYMADNHFCDELNKQEVPGKTTVGFIWTVLITLQLLSFFELKFSITELI